MYAHGTVWGIYLHTTGHKVNTKIEECWKSNKCKHLQRPRQSPWFAFHMFACCHTLKARAALALYTSSFFICPSCKRTHSKQANISFLRDPACRPFRITILPLNRTAAAHSGACPICSGFHSCARLFSRRQRAGDGHLAGGDAEEQQGPVSHAWLEHQHVGVGGGAGLLRLHVCPPVSIAAPGGTRAASRYFEAISLSPSLSKFICVHLCVVNTWCYGITGRHAVRINQFTPSSCVFSSEGFCCFRSVFLFFFSFLDINTIQIKLRSSLYVSPSGDAVVFSGRWLYFFRLTTSLFFTFVVFNLFFCLAELKPEREGSLPRLLPVFSVFARMNKSRTNCWIAF